jgi:hypothetical protein
MSRRRRGYAIEELYPQILEAYLEPLLTELYNAGGSLPVMLVWPRMTPHLVTARMAFELIKQAKQAGWVTEQRGKLFLQEREL